MNILNDLENYKTQCGFPWRLISIDNKSIHGIILYKLPNGNTHEYPITWDEMGVPYNIMNNIGLRLVKIK